MKKLTLIFALLIGVTAINNEIQAQKVNVNINIGTQPAWGPVGYDYAEYYYMPDINVYYMVNSNRFVYPDRDRWVTATYLPYSYRNCDLYGMYKVVLVDAGREPWRYNTVHYRDYGRYRGYRDQVVIRDSRDRRYYSSRNNRVAWYRSEPSSRPHYNNNVRPQHQSRPSSNSHASSRPSQSVNTRPSSNSRPSSSVSSRPSQSRNNATVREVSRSSSSDRGSSSNTRATSSTRSSSR